MSDPKTITSPANPLVKALRGLTLKKNRDEGGLFIIEGLRHVGEAVADGWMPQMILADARAANTADYAALLSACATSGTRFFDVTADILSRITQRDNAQSLIGVFKQKSLTLDAVSKSGDGIWVALENIRDPGNLGTILRTADAAGIAGIVLLGQTCDPWSPETVRAAMGSLTRMPIVTASLADLAVWRKSWRGKLIGTHLRTETDFRNADYTAPLMIVMGNESNGMSDAAAKLCDTLVKIPMPGRTESLNLSISTALMIYEAGRKSF